MESIVGDSEGILFGATIIDKLAPLWISFQIPTIPNHPPGENSLVNSQHVDTYVCICRYACVRRPQWYSVYEVLHEKGGMLKSTYMFSRALVSATFIRLWSARNPTFAFLPAFRPSPTYCALTALKMTRSFSRPWKPSTVLTSMGHGFELSICRR